jgi:hypothetical protein
LASIPGLAGLSDLTGLSGVKAVKNVNGQGVTIVVNSYGRIFEKMFGSNFDKISGEPQTEEEPEPESDTESESESESEKSEKYKGTDSDDDSDYTDDEDYNDIIVDHYRFFYILKRYIQNPILTERMVVLVAKFGILLEKLILNTE